MKIETPDLLSLTYQPLYMERKLFMSFTAALAFDLSTGLPSEPGSAFAAAMSSLAPGDCLDMGVPKTEAEWLLAGSAFSPGGVPAKRTAVSVQVGESGRTLLVEGCEPFTSMKLTWRAAWGNDAENPDGPRPGKGSKPPVSDAALPYGSPACMGPRGAWPCRMGRMGTYDAKWLKENWPGVPGDFDWSFYNLSQPGQRLPKGINGGEQIVLKNLNGNIPEIKTKIPKAAAAFRFDAGGRTFEKRPHPDTLWLFPGELTGLLLWHAVTECRDEAGAGIDSVVLELELDGEPAVSGAAPAVETSLPGAQDAAPRTADEAAGAVAAASAAVGAAAAAGASGTGAGTEMGRRILEDPAKENAAGAEVPGVSRAPAEEMMMAGEFRENAYRELQESLPEINSALAEAGLPPLTADQVAETKAHIDRLTGKMAQLQAQVAAAKEPSLEDALKRAGASDEQILSVKRALDIPVPNHEDFTDKTAWEKAVDAYAAEFCSVVGGDEKIMSRMKNILSSLPVGEQPEKSAAASPRECTAQLVKAGMEPGAAARLVAVLEEGIPEDPKDLLNYASRVEQAAGFPPGSVRDRIENIQRKMEEHGVPFGGGQAAQPAHDDMSGAARRMSEKAEPEKIIEKTVKTSDAVRPTRESIAETLAAGGSLAGAKLDGVDLSGFDLSGQNLKGASFAKAKLDGASFGGACLAGAVFTASSLKDVSFTGADLSGADLASACLDDCDLSEAMLSGAVFTGASLRGVSVYKADAKGIAASGADFSKARVSFADLSGADFSGAKLKTADFHGTCADGANFAKADLAGSTFCWGSSARECNFSGADLSGANWTGSDMRGSDFSGISAPGASFTGCDLSSSRWDRAELSGGDFSRSSLEGASMRCVNLFRGSLREARAFGADLSGSNLFSADLCRMFVNEATEMGGADVGQTIIEARKGL